MYIHRIVIDTNQINARGKIRAMNRLEEYHHAGVVEILTTSTLAADFGKAGVSPQRAKAAGYYAIGGSAQIQLSNDIVDAAVGASGRESKWWEIYKTVFSEAPPDPNHPPDRRAMRDAMHLDQANQHAVDFFVTEDKGLLEARDRLQKEGHSVSVCTADECLHTLERYFDDVYSTVEPDGLRAELNSGGRIIIGSNSTNYVSLAAAVDNEELLRLAVQAGEVKVNATIRDSTGETMLSIEPGREFHFASPGASVRMMRGPAPLRIGIATCKTFTVTVNDQVVLSGRVSPSGHVVFSEGRLRDRDGELVAEIKGEFLELRGSNMRFSGVAC